MLSDPARRASYDAQGSAGLAGATAEDLWGGIDFTDIFGSGAAAFGGLFERLFGPAAAAPQRGQDVRLDLVLSLDEVLAGGNHAVTIRRPGPCPQCAGSGSGPGTTPRRCPGCGGTGQRAVAGRHGPLLVRRVITCPECGGRGRLIDQPCPACAASGRALREETVTIRIRPGIPEGATLRLAGHGMPGPMPGGPPGDAYVRIRTRADPRFTRAGADLWYDLHIQAPDAALGVTAAVPVLQGQARVRVPPGTRPGSVLRLGGKGLPRYGGHGRGSLNLTVILDIPRQLSPRQRQLYEQLRAEDGGITGTVAGSAEPDAPRSGGRIKASTGGRHAAGRSLMPLAALEGERELRAGWSCGSRSWSAGSRWTARTRARRARRSGSGRKRPGKRGSSPSGSAARTASAAGSPVIREKAWDGTRIRTTCRPRVRRGVPFLPRVPGRRGCRGAAVGAGH